VEVLRSTVSVGERKRMILQGEGKEVATKLAKALVQEGVLKAS
jgi:hypothetical protein